MNDTRTRIFRRMWPEFVEELRSLVSLETLQRSSSAVHGRRGLSLNPGQPRRLCAGTACVDQTQEQDAPSTSSRSVWTKLGTAALPEDKVCTSSQ